MLIYIANHLGLLHKCAKIKLDRDWIYLTAKTKIESHQIGLFGESFVFIR